MLYEIEKIFEKLGDEERICLKEIHTYCNVASVDFDELFDNMYFDTDEFEEAILKYAELIKFRKKLYEHID